MWTQTYKRLRPQTSMRINVALSDICMLMLAREREREKLDASERETILAQQGNILFRLEAPCFFVLPPCFRLALAMSYVCVTVPAPLQPRMGELLAMMKQDGISLPLHFYSYTTKFMQRTTIQYSYRKLCCARASRNSHRHTVAQLSQSQKVVTSHLGGST